MRKRSEKLMAFALGVLAAFTVSTLAEPVLAAGSQILYNRVGVSLFDEVRYAAGETFTGENGQELPSSITYVDAAGGMTNYLPVRRIAELFNTRIEWNGAESLVEIDPSNYSGGSYTTGDIPLETLPTVPVYGTVSGAFEEIDPATVERDTEGVRSSFYMQNARIQTERYGMPEYTANFADPDCNCVFFTVTNNGNEPVAVNVMRSVSPLTSGVVERFTKVQLDPGETITRAFRMAEDADPLQCSLIFNIRPVAVRGATDVTLTLEQFLAK